MLYVRIQGDISMIISLSLNWRDGFLVNLKSLVNLAQMYMEIGGSEES
jgi:hypothetical protein